MSLESTTKPISASRTVRVIKNLRWWMLGMFLLGVTVNYITPQLARHSGTGT
ncbi:UNVERIFIED_ORG: citrate lyase synthetase [Pantoea brenneri]|nr:citrate lyase synthetase [Pantoea brenneri]